METYNDCYKIVHISNEIKLEEKSFIPRVPRTVAKNEDIKQERICFAETVQGALGGIPYKGELVKRVISESFTYLSLYEVDKRIVNHKTTEEIKHLVPDAHLTGEYWVTEQITLKPRIIKVTELRLDGYNAYTDSHSGFVKQLNYESSISERDREEIIELVGKSFKKKAIRWAKENDIPYIVLEENVGSLQHRRFVANEDGVYKGTSKPYQLSKIKFEIPAGVDIGALWLVHAENREYLEKANLRPLMVEEIADNQESDGDWFLRYQDYLEEQALKKKEELKAV